MKKPQRKIVQLLMAGAGQGQGLLVALDDQGEAWMMETHTGPSAQRLLYEWTKLPALGERAE